MRAFPVWKYIVMGAFDAVASILMVRLPTSSPPVSPPDTNLTLPCSVQIFGGSKSSGPMQQVRRNKFLTGKKENNLFNWNDLLGALANLSPPHFSLALI